MIEDVLTPGTMFLALLAALAARVLFRSRRTADTAEPGPGGGELQCRDVDRCSWKLHVVGIARHRCTIVVFGRSVHLRRGDLLLALRPRPGVTQQPAAMHEQSGDATSADLSHVS